MGKFIGIDEILQGGASPHSTRADAPQGDRRGQGGTVLTKTSLEYPLELHRKVKRYAIDNGMKEKQVITLAVREFFERHQ